MKRRVTIAARLIRHNRTGVVTGWRLPARAALTWACAAFGLSSLAACVAPAPVPEQVPAWELAHAEPANHRILARVRVSYDRPLPLHLTQTLCDEYTLVTITNAADWNEVQRRLGLRPPRGPVDFSRGVVIGILADVGEAVSGQWPISLGSIRTQDGEGWVEIDFASGLYHPLQCAGYLELAYVPGLRNVRMVRINSKTFMIRSTTGAH